MKSALKIVSVIALVLVTCTAYSQDKPSDYLDNEFHKNRRELLRTQLPANAVAVFFSNPVRNRANDVDYMYHQDPNFYYLTGHKEPHSVLLIFKEPQTVGEKTFDELIFVRAHNALKELYEGGRLGKEGAMENLEFDLAFEGPDFANMSLDFSKFDKVLFYDFENDVRDTEEEGDLYDLIASFKEMVGYGGETALDPEPRASNLDTETLDPIMDKMRGIKTPDELELLRKAIDISTIGQSEVMKAMHPGMSEMEIQGLHEYVFKKYQAEYEGYPSIVGAGHNGCVLHYIDNYKPSIEDGEMILMDLGAEYHGYTADVTRTIPVNGKFSPEQKIIYDLVYDAQEAGWELCKEGVTFDAVKQKTIDVVNNGLLELGIFKTLNEEEIINPATGRNWYYPHGCCHHIGLDVHDKGEYNELEENMVITIEPGIYIPAGSPCDEKWWDIAVRIEDDYLIQKEGCELLSDLAPRKSDAIEALMKESSPLDDFKLPELGGK